MKNFKHLLQLVILVFITSCEDNYHQKLNELSENVQKVNENCGSLSIAEFNEKINTRKDTITFSCFNEMFGFKYEKLKLNDEYLFLPDDPILLQKNDLNLYHAFFRCYYKTIDSCRYNLFLVVDSTKSIKYFSIKNYTTNATEELFYTDSLLIDKVLGGIEKH